MKEEDTLMKLRTMGRWPTKGELCEYYARDDICAVIYYQSKRWKILMEFGDEYLLEPTSEKDAREKILGNLRDFSYGVKETERLPEYPTMHILRDRGEMASVRFDFMFEEDPQSWKQGFDEMAKALDVLDACDAYYQMKFSGHKSLHLIIPAEAFPRTFRGKSVNEQFSLIEKRLKIYLRSYMPRVGRATPAGLRVVYSTNPKSGMVSIPLRRKELPCFQPWMANIYTVAVDFDWFAVPSNAVERTEKLLHLVFDNGQSNPVTVSTPAFQPLPVKAYTGDALWNEAEILKAIDSEHPQERVAGARAALVQNIRLPQEKLKRLLYDTERDTVWFGMEIAMRDASSVKVEDIIYLLGQKDDYLVGLGHQLVAQSAIEVDSVIEYLTCQREVNHNTVVAVRLIADMDWLTYAELPERIKAASLREWFEKVWVICGSALCHIPEPVFQSAYRYVETCEANEEERNDKIHQLELLMKLRNTQPRKKIKDEPLFQAADELIQYGHNLRGVVMAMLNSGGPMTSQGALRYLTRLWWDDCIDILIQWFNLSSSRRKSALKALVDIGEPAVEPLIYAIQTTQSQNITIMSMQALGQLGNPRAISIIQERTHHPDERIHSNARRVLRTYFDIEMQPEKIDASAPDASEVE
jgi:hypothetical protein